MPVPSSATVNDDSDITKLAVSLSVTVTTTVPVIPSYWVSVDPKPTVTH